MKASRFECHPAEAACRSATGAVATLLGPAAPGSAAAKTRRGRTPRAKRRDGKNWCLDRTQTCGPAGVEARCFVEAYGGNVCGQALFQAKDCADCAPGWRANCRCLLAIGGGDRCNNGANGFDFICVRPL